MVPFHITSKPLLEKERNQLLFKGTIIIFCQLDATKRLRDAVYRTAEKCYHPYSPLTAHRDLTHDEFVSASAKLQKEIRENPSYHKLLIDMLEACGLEKTANYWVKPTLRTLPGKEKYLSRATSSLGRHRDTWYGNMYAQHNWWFPILPLEKNRTLEFTPTHWSEPVPNNSKGWSLEAFREARQQVASKAEYSYEEYRDAYDEVRSDVEIDDTLSSRIIVEPGDIIVFSAAQLHRGIPNQSDYTRISMELRTLSLESHQQGVGAPNIDGYSEADSFNDFYEIGGNK